MAPIIISKVCCWIKIRDYLILCLLQRRSIRPQAILWWGPCVNNAPSWERRTSSVCVRTKILPHFPQSHSCLWHSYVCLWQTTSNCRCMCGDRRWNLGYKEQSREDTRNSSFLIKVISVLTLTREDLILLTLNQHSNSHQVQWYQTFQNRDTIYLKHQAGNDNNRRNVKITHRHFRHSSWFLL